MGIEVRTEDGQSFSVDERDSILTAALRSGVGFPHECCVGGCGACRFELLAGSVVDLWPDAPGLSARDRARGKRLACQSLPAANCEIRVRTSSDHVPPIRPGRLPVTLEAVADITRDLREFTFRSKQAAQFLPGQFALLDVPNVRGLRAYSMSNLPNAEGVWQFIIRRVAGGQATHILFDEMRPGDNLELDGPYGSAWLREDSTRHIVCIAGGSGLAPVLSIARAAAIGRSDRSVRFFYGARSTADLCGEPQLAQLPGYGERLHFRAAISDPDPQWTGPSGFIHELVEADLGSKLPEFDFYFAGPPAMITAVQELLVVRHRVPHNQIHFDRFL